jgi:hypothetical protein
VCVCVCVCVMCVGVVWADVHRDVSERDRELCSYAIPL